MIIITNNQSTEDSLPLFAICGKPGIESSWRPSTARWKIHQPAFRAVEFKTRSFKPDDRQEDYWRNF